MTKNPRENLHVPPAPPGSAPAPGSSPGSSPGSVSPRARTVVIACAVLEEEVRHFAADMPHIVHLEMMEQGLHNDPPLLRDKLQDAIDRVERAHRPDVVVLVYGLCSRGTEGVRTQRARLVIARAQDCITHLLGSKEKYAAYVAEHPGTYWYSPGWNKHHTPPGRDRYENLLRQYTEKYGEDNAQYLMETEQHWFTAYDRATFVDLTVGQTNREAAYTKQCADWLGWKFDRQQGDPQLLIDLLEGNWDNDRFVVLEPGRSFELCADDRVIEPAPTLPVTLLTPRGEVAFDVTADQRTLADHLAEHDHALNTRCGQKGICDGCVVSLVKGKLAPPAAAGDKVKACQHRLQPGEPLTVRIPKGSLLGHQPQVVSQFKINIPFAHDPWPVATGRSLGVAVDIGTTTVVAALIDLQTGRILSRQSAFNKQIREGDNVLTRINLCSTDSAALDRLRAAVVEQTLAPLLQSALQHAEKQGEQVGVIAVAGNTTMLHLLAGVDPSAMGVAPFTPTFVEHRIIEPGALRNVIADDTPVHLLPGAAAYVGADIVAGMIATGLAYDDGPALLIDIGTNGEIVLRHGDRLVGCATAAGPAFEGAGLSSGRRAGEGAIAHVVFDPMPRFEIIGGGEPEGICGSGYIDLLAEARRAGLLNERGRYEPDVAKQLNVTLVQTDTGGRAWQIAPDVLLSESDIAALLQAKAAIAAGILTLLDRCGIDARDLKTCHLAGGFGLHLNVANTIACGLLPGFDASRVRAVGNTALAGAYLALIDRHTVDQMAEWSTRMDIIELNLDASYETRFIEQLSL